ncbi:glycoside hydrolase family 43 protein [Sinomicrobium pectinilyticum]|uniref:Glycoside hydrolase family 43 protein n=1 Tax=Sinomicrobium pectinilyticum TaxID=1084421 RepID=A0A3N0EIY0_SINP1|nr:glycoside hydrolase family 43 protein [Sinomicrobium pectinilyticum]
MPKFAICPFLFKSIFFAVLFVQLTGCRQKEEQLHLRTAYFDYFHYNGEDDFYKENPLPDAESFYNPILLGWYSDPSICRNGDDYFLVTSTFSYFPGVPVFHSTDLVNWKQIGNILNRPSQLELDGQRTSQGIFAPAISYNPHNEIYYMITTNIGGGNFFVKTKDPFGEWSDPVWLPDVHGIDPSFFFDDDGKAYIVNNDEPDGGSTYEGHRAIRIVEFDVENEKTTGASKMLVNGGVDLKEKPIWIEGPHMYKINGKYFLMCAEGGTSVNHREVIFSSETVMGPYKPWDKNPILTQKHLDPERPLPVTCAGHADLIQKQDGEWWAVFLACRPIENEFENLGRETFLMPVKWSDDGFPYMTRGNETVPRILKMEGVSRKDNVTFGNFSVEEEFDNEQLAPQWMTLRGPADSLYSLREKPGCLALKCTDVNTTELKEPAFVTRRLQHHRFTCETALLFAPETENEQAGLLLFKDEKHQYGLLVRKKGEGMEISVQKISPEGTETLGNRDLPENNTSKPVELKIISSGKYFEFFCKQGNNEWNKVADQVPARHLSTANSYGFTGTTVGMYAGSGKF